VWFSGRTLASQAKSGGSIPLTRSLKVKSKKLKMKENTNFGFYLALLPFYFLLFTFFGCAAPTPYVKPTAPPAPQGMPGIYHRVIKGETLWRISKIYNVDIDVIAQINHISDNTSLEIGQQVFIPNAGQPKPVPVYVKYTSDDFIWPLRGRVISGFGQISNNMVNKGINIQPLSSSDVLAARQGRVVFYTNNLGVFGKTIIIEHPDGLSTVYARNSQVYIKVGDVVGKGACIAKAGSSGRDSNTYLHFEIRKGHIPVNPFHYLP
jgi:murein DD-endopeptidase MepM/ murein hydrolase activator NlpD